jgi:hypothetical protein
LCELKELDRALEVVPQPVDVLGYLLLGVG